MRAAGISTVQQTLTSEAANVLKLAIADAQRRGHVQVTPLHVAATLLTSGAAGVLRHACIQSHLHLPSPPQCRALELCFNVALDRLQTTSSSSSPSSAAPPVLNNALVAALKRAQAHQRRGYPEQQQVPLLAVKVEMEQLVVSILDDPSVSRVMREAGFSSTQVKSSLEDAMAAAAAAAAAAGIGIPAAVATTAVRLKLGPSLLDAAASSAPKPSSPATSHRHGHDVARALQVMLKPGRKRSPLLLGDANAPHSVAEELLRRLDDQVPPPLRGAKVVTPQLASIALGLHTREEVERKLGDLTRTAEDLSSSPLVLFLGDLQWLIERPPSSAAAAAYCPVQHAIGEIARLVASAGSRVWLLAVASSQTYIRCQGRHPGLDALWGLQPLPVASIAGLGLGLRSNPLINSRTTCLEGRTSSHSLDSYPSPPTFRCWPPLTPVKLSSIPSMASEQACCSECTSKLEQELAQEQEKEALEGGKSKIDSLPLWLKQSTNNQQERKDLLQRKWLHTCLRLHGSSQNALKAATTPTSSIPWLSLQSAGSTTDKRMSTAAEAPAGRAPEIGLSLASPPPEVATELVLGRITSSSRNKDEEPSKKFIFNRGLASLKQQQQQQQLLSRGTSPSSDGSLPGVGMFKKLSNGEHPVDWAVRRPVSGTFEWISGGFDKGLDFKGLVKSLEENVPWQKEAVQAIASEVLQCRSGLRARRSGLVKTDAWLLLLGPDTMGKRKTARLLAEHIFGSDKHFTKISLRTIGQYVRGRTPLDRIVEAVRTKPFSVLLLEDVDHVDSRLKSALAKAMDCGRLADSTGREASIVNSIFVMTSGRGEELLLPPLLESSKLKLSERSVSGAEIVGMKLKPREQPEDEQVLYRCGRVTVVGPKQSDLPRSGDNAAAAAVPETRGRNCSNAESLVADAKIKRKGDGTVECRKRNRPMAPLDLNIDPEPEVPPQVEEEREEADQVEEDEGASKQLVKEALESLGADFCKGLSATVVLRPFDFDKVGEMVVEEVNKVLAGWKQIHELEMEWEVLNQLVAVLWQGQRDEFFEWVARVLRASISKLVEEQPQDKISIVKLAADKVEPGVSHLPLAIKTEAIM